MIKAPSNERQAFQKKVKEMAKRRANSGGNIRKRKDGRWEGPYTAGYADSGKLIIRNVPGKTQAAVKTKLKNAVALADVSDVASSGLSGLGLERDPLCQTRD